MPQTFSNLGKFSDINKQFHVKSWLTYRSYCSVWWILSCSMYSQPQIHSHLICIPTHMTAYGSAKNTHTMSLFIQIVFLVKMSWTISSKIAKFWLLKSFFSIKNLRNLSELFFSVNNRRTTFTSEFFWKLLFLMYTRSSHNAIFGTGKNSH